MRERKRKRKENPCELSDSNQRWQPRTRPDAWQDPLQPANEKRIDDNSIVDKYEECSWTKFIAMSKSRRKIHQWRISNALLPGFIRELGAAERIYCREQTDYGNQTLVQVLIISKEKKIDQSKARQALITLYQDYCSILGYQICPSDDRTTLVFKSKDAHQAEEDLMSHFQYQQVALPHRWKKSSLFCFVEYRLAYCFRNWIKYSIWWWESNAMDSHRWIYSHHVHSSRSSRCKKFLFTRSPISVALFLELGKSPSHDTSSTHGKISIRSLYIRINLRSRSQTTSSSSESNRFSNQTSTLVTFAIHSRSVDRSMSFPSHPFK